jgi:ABC-type Fe3+ transport system permease subunit
MLILLPGLMGALALGLTVAAMVSQRPLVIFRDTPAPLVLAQILWLLPRAVLLRLLIGRWRDSTSIHKAQLLSRAADAARRRPASAVLWRLDAAPRFWGLLLVCYWAYIELTLPSLLAPPGMTPAPVVLYNLMHYGQISGLSAMLFATMAVPVVLMLGGWWGYRAHSPMRLARRASKGVN